MRERRPPGRISPSYLWTTQANALTSHCMDDRAPALKHFGPLPTLPTLEEAKGRLALGLPPNFALFAADLLAHPDRKEEAYYGHDVSQSNQTSTTRGEAFHSSVSVKVPEPGAENEIAPAPNLGRPRMG